MMRNLSRQTTLPVATRRNFMLGVAAVGGALVVGFNTSRAQAQAALPAGIMPAKVIAPFDVYLQIKPDGAVHILSSQFEMGQGVFNGIATLVAEELDFDWSKMTIADVFGDPANYGNLKQGGAFQITGGSSSMPSSFMRYRQAGATAREMLLAAAAKQWAIPVEGIVIENGLVKAGEKSENMGTFAAAAAGLPVPAAPTLKPREQWKYIGNQQRRRFDTGKMARGQQDYTIDVKLDGMLTAVPVHGPRFKSKVKSFDAKATKAVKGVVDVVAIPSGLAVVAENTWAAIKGREVLKVEWDNAAAEMRSTPEIESEIRAALAQPGKVTAVTVGDVNAAFAATGAKTLEAEFHFPYLAHAALEPLNAVARINADGTVEVWGGHQMPSVHAMTAAAIAGVDIAKVKLHHMRTGGGFGRRATTTADVVSEAVAAAKAVGRPVKMQWTREDDTRGGSYRPMFGHKLKASLDAEGNISGWQHLIVGGSIFRGTPFEGFIQNNVDVTMVEGAEKLPYAMATRNVALTEVNTGVPVLWWRAVGGTHNCHAVECFMDELANAASKNPLAFRMGLLKDKPRHAKVLQTAAEKANWGQPAEGRFQGLALTESFDTIVAHVAEIAMNNGVMKVEKVTVAVDCGIAINPDTVKAQVEGGTGFGLGALLKSRITMKEGEVVEGNFDGYEVLRIDEMPHVDVHIVESGEYPMGIGEPGLPGIGPAVANAYFKATNKMLRFLPMSSPDNA